MASSIQETKKKKRHQNPKKTKTSETLTLKEVKTLGSQLLSSRAHINNLPTLLSVLSPSSPLKFSLEALISLQSFFVPLVNEIPSKTLADPSKEKDPELVYKAWLRARFDEFVNSLIETAVDSRSEEALKDVALDAIMDFVKLGKDGKFQSAIYHRLLHSIVRNTSSVDSLIDLLASKYFKYLDVRYFTYTSLYKVANDSNSRHMADCQKEDSQTKGELSESRMETAVRIIYYILSHIPPMESTDKEPTYEMWSQLGISPKEAEKASSDPLSGNSKSQKPKGMHSEASSVNRILKKIKLKFTNAWLSFLRLPLPLDIYKEVLATLHQNVLPYMANPAILCDFLTMSYDIGGVISVMALSGLFVLMTKHGLEYPKFYEKLYALLTPAVFMAKHRALFFQLLDTCLKSSHLPAYLAAAFAKRLSRMALSVTPSGERLIIAIIHNLLRRHPSINFLVNKQDEEADGEASEGGDNSSQDAGIIRSVVQSKKHGIDPFKSEESDPSKSDAMRSSLWEIDTLRHHYCPAVSRFVASLESDLTVRAKTSEVTVADYCSGSYGTLFKQEVERRVKQVPLAFYKATPNTLFWGSEFPGWSFQDPRDNKQEGQDVDKGVSKTLGKDHTGSVKRQRVECV
ncbi:nucleolar complex protein 4 homolog isoform X2 [Asparagus officinalis]|uniref:nucleolar complex protein 4 homolog isoform X2 n=1 Tax=Asparagus officinalis TaxID=4686 RepID=UPI00098E8551|nr:nucleolar complex protein 4 homolog isoform X2 [Asparagus officinalis]